MGEIKRKLICVFIPTLWELSYPKEVREFLDRFVITRRSIPPDMDGTVYMLEGEQFPEIEPFHIIPIIYPTIVGGSYMKVIYI